MTLDRLWAGWRSEYLESTTGDDDDDGCVFCRTLASDAPGNETYVVWRGERAAALLNKYPYTSGHVMVLPVRHVGELEDLGPDEALEVWSAVTDAVRAVKAAYRPGGLNVGANLGRAGGAGVPGHFHVHCLPRWAGDTNFMTSIAEARVLPEPLGVTYGRLAEAWPRSPD